MTRLRWSTEAARAVLADQASEHSDEVIGDGCDAIRCVDSGIAREGCDFDSRGCFDDFTSRDRERACLVWTRDATCTFGAIETDALGGPKSVIAKVGIANSCGPNGDEELLRELKRVKLVMGKND